MPKSSTTFTVVLASPGDMAADRDVVEVAIEELNELLRDRCVKIDCRRWEKHGIPAVTDDAQGAINKQLLDGADIVIALFGSRLGTPTKSAKSGTAEEIDVVLRNPDDKFDGMNLQIYFSRKPVQIWEVDINEIARLKEFRHEIQSKALVAEYDNLEDLGSRVRLGLSKAVESWAKRDSKPVDGVEETPPLVVNVANDEPEEEEFGLLDLQLLMEQHLSEGTKSLELSASALRSFSDKVEGHTQLINKGGMAQAATSDKIRLMDAVAKDMFEVAEQLTAGAVATKSSYNKAFDALEAMVDMQESQMNQDGPDAIDRKSVV